MPRSARIVVPNCPHHIVHRGHNRSVVFADDEDYQYYLNNLFEWVKLLKCKLYGFCLMTNHVHLLIDPGDETMYFAGRGVMKSTPFKTFKKE